MAKRHASFIREFADATGLPTRAVRALVRHFFSPRDIEEAALQRIGEQFDAMADAFANEAGLPPGGKRYSTDEQLAEWNYSPIADPVTRAETMAQLLGMGVSVEKITDQIYPNRRRLVTT